MNKFSSIIASGIIGLVLTGCVGGESREPNTTTLVNTTVSGNWYCAPMRSYPVKTVVWGDAFELILANNFTAVLGVDDDYSTHEWILHANDDVTVVWADGSTDYYTHSGDGLENGYERCERTIPTTTASTGQTSSAGEEPTNSFSTAGSDTVFLFNDSRWTCFHKSQNGMVLSTNYYLLLSRNGGAYIRTNHDHSWTRQSEWEYNNDGENLFIHPDSGDASQNWKIKLVDRKTELHLDRKIGTDQYCV